MKIKILIATLIPLVMLSFMVYADLWDEQLDMTKTKAESKASWDETRAMYKANVDFDQAAGKDLDITWKHKMGLGCSGFGLSENLFNDMTGEALTEYATGIIKNALAASPELLLAYLSPTLYDKLKELKAHSAKLLDLKFKKCEDIQKAVMGSDFMKKRKVEAYSEEMDQDLATDSADLDKSLKKIEDYKKSGKQPKPRDWTGKSVDKLNVWADDLQKVLDKWNKMGTGKLPIDEAILKEVPKFIGEIEVSESGSDKKPPTKTISGEYKKEKEKCVKALKEATGAYEKEHKSSAVTGDILKNIQGAHKVVRPEVIAALCETRRGSSETEYDTWLSGLASEIAYDRVNWKVNEMIRGIGYMLAASTKDADKDFYQEGRDYLRGEQQSFKSEYIEETGGKNVRLALMERVGEKREMAKAEADVALHAERKKPETEEIKSEAESVARSYGWEKGK